MQDPSSDVLRVRRLEVVDDVGRVRLVLGQVDHGSFGLAVLDDAGERRIELATHPDGPALSFGAAGDVVAEIGVRDAVDDALAAGAYLVLERENTTDRL